MTGRFREVNLLVADLVTVTKSACRFTDGQIWGGGKSAGGRFSDCHQICQSANLLVTDLVTVTKSASRFTDWQI